MNKIYLKLKTDISILVADGNWSLHTGDMIVLQKIGTKSEIKRNEYKANEYIHSDSYLLTGFEYRTIKDMRKAFIDRVIEHHMVWNECNSVDTLITISTGSPLYHSRTYTYSSMSFMKESGIPLVDKITFDDVFEDVSITYNRENKLKEILNYE
jgi:hypothetical protein